MTKISNSKELDKIFEAFANRHRREIVYALSLQPCSISRLAEIRNFTLPAIYKHIKILKKAKLVLERKIGRIHFLSLNRDSLIVLQDWLAQYHPFWGNNSETLKNYEKYLKGGENK